MKILTTSFLTCAVKSCKSSPASFPLHYRDVELEVIEMAYNPAFLQGILPRLDWDAVRVTAGEVGEAHDGRRLRRICKVDHVLVARLHDPRVKA